jgi:hypothetical protein
MIIEQKKRGVNWILPVAPRGDDIQLYLEPVFTLVMSRNNPTKDNCQEPILKFN